MSALFKRKVYETRQEKTRDFIIGVLICLVLNGLLFGCSLLVPYILFNSTAPTSSLQDTLNAIAILSVYILPWVLNLGLLIYFAFTRPWIALGGLALFGVFLALVILAGIVFLVYCFVVVSQL
jgi:hypothetical protein